MPTWQEKSTWLNVKTRETLRLFYHTDEGRNTEREILHACRSCILMAVLAEALGTVWVGKRNVFCRGKESPERSMMGRLACVWGCVHQGKQYLTNKTYICKCALCVSFCKHARGKCLQMRRGSNDRMLLCVHCKWAHVFTTVKACTHWKYGRPLTVCVFIIQWNVCTYVISITVYTVLCLGKLVLRLWFSVLCASSRPCPGLGSFNTFTVPGCRAAVDEHT